MRIGVISDTHGQVTSARDALRVLDAFGVAMILHCGDVGIEIIPLLKGRKVHVVCGNTDDPDRLRRALNDPGHTFHNHLGRLEIGGCRVALLHGDDEKLLHQTIHSGQCDLVCHGHTHAFSSSHQRGTLVLNPGALSRTQRPSVAVVEIPSLEVTHVPL
jgi:uncharacterized protein